jgi:DNA-binding NtrC family response regulator
MVSSTHLLTVRPPAFTFDQFRLRVIEGPDKGKQQASEGAELAVGTDPGNQLVLTDPTVSRHHCVVVATPDGFQLRDLDSTNGTTIAGCRIGWAYLTPGTVVGLGASQLRFESLGTQIREPLSRDPGFGRAIGRSVEMGRIFAILPRIAGSNSTVLIEGETGTGKGLLARSLHEASPRAPGPFVVVDCGAIPPSLIESELFGHDRGAFTGAHAARPGAFEAAQGGTVFLDEISELPLEMQPKLLRVLEERTVKRIGSTQPIRLDLRIVAATNQELRKAVNRGTFRADLYYRLNTVRLRLPPLRERAEDIPMLVEHFYRQFAGDDAGAPPTEMVEALNRHDWPGNVRELRSAVERAVLMGDAAAALALAEPAGEPRGAQEPTDESLSFRVAKERATARWEWQYLSELVRRAGGNLSRAAREARMDRGHLRELLARHKIRIRDDGSE